VVTLVLVLPWTENYGSEHEYHASGLQKLWHSIKHSLQVISTRPDICMLGLSQAFFEGAVYTFVFMWVPSLMKAADGPIPTGLLFSAFMLTMTWGGTLSALLLPLLPGGPETLCCLIYLFSAVSMAVPIYSFDFWSVLAAFLVLETMVGMFNSCGATLRSRHYPQDLQASLMSVFRLPLNLLVVLGTRLANSAQEVADLRFVFGVVVMMHWVALVLQLCLCLFPSASGTGTGTDGKQKVL